MLTAVGSFVEWMITLPGGIALPYPVGVKLHPMPKTTSALSRNRATCLVVDVEAAPSESGWFSGKALLPGSVVITGACSSSAAS